MKSRRSGAAPGIEYRFSRASVPQADGDHLSGRAAPFNRMTMIGAAPWGFREKVAPGAFARSINARTVVLLDNHDTARPLARMSAGTLELRESDSGLDWEASPANTSYARDVAENVRAGNYGGCSFGFEVVSDSWIAGDDGIDERTLHEVKLHEISVVTFPAYEDTAVSSRDALESAMEARGRYFERLMRAKYDAQQLKDMLAKGQALKNPAGDPSYPIADEEDLKNAIHAVGRGAGEHDAIRKYIIGRAKALGLSSLIPDNWNADGSIGGQNSAGAGEARDKADGDDTEDAKPGAKAAENATAGHGPVTGTHTHGHPAMGSQGGDDTHSHSHSHDGDSDHSHHDNVEQNSKTPGEAGGRPGYHHSPRRCRRCSTHPARPHVARSDAPRAVGRRTSYCDVRREHRPCRE